MRTRRRIAQRLLHSRCCSMVRSEQPWLRLSLSLPLALLRSVCLPRVSTVSCGHGRPRFQEHREGRGRGASRGRSSECACLRVREGAHHAPIDRSVRIIASHIEVHRLSVLLAAGATTGRRVGRREAPFRLSTASAAESSPPTHPQDRNMGSRDLVSSEHQIYRLASCIQLRSRRRTGGVDGVHRRCD